MGSCSARCRRRLRMKTGRVGLHGNWKGPQSCENATKNAKKSGVLLWDDEKGIMEI